MSVSPSAKNGATGRREEGAQTLLLAMGAPVLLVVVALMQLYLSANFNLSPWKGGGFGMFASVDRVEHRAIGVSFEGAGTMTVDIEALRDNSFPDEQLVDRVRSMPTQAAMERLGRRIDDMAWALTPEGVLTPAGGSSNPAVDLPPAIYPLVVIRVWRVVYDAEVEVVSPAQLEQLVRRREL